MNKIAGKLQRWYPGHARPLPWRRDDDPYHVWVAEVMLQQTRVVTVIPYYQRWMKCFPTLRSLARADQQQVLKLWEGLGYYSRARNLHNASRIIMQEYHGIIPSTVEELVQLPGIGRSTAGAIVSISFHQDKAILDGNVKRILSRLFDYAKPVNEPSSQKKLWLMAASVLPRGRAGIFNQALMELGETICIPGKPICEHCPLAKECLAHQKGLQDQRPVRQSKPRVPHYEVVAAVISRNGKYLLAQRPPGKLLAGMWEFPGGKLEKGETLEKGLRRELREELDIQVRILDELGVYRHAYTHFSVSVHALDCRLQKGRLRPRENQSIAWLAPPEFDEVPMGKVDRLIAREIIFRLGQSV